MKVTFDPVDPDSGYVYKEKIKSNLSLISHMHHDHSYIDAIDLIEHSELLKPFMTMKMEMFEDIIIYML